MEWVYEGDHDEPTVYEAMSAPRYAPAQPAGAVQNEDEDEFFGDPPDPSEELPVSPRAAFEKFVARAQRPVDFSGDIYPRVEQGSRRVNSEALPAEGRAERIRRLQREVCALEEEDVGGVDGGAEGGILEELRLRLRAVERAVVADAVTGGVPGSRVLMRKAKDVGSVSKEDDGNAVSKGEGRHNGIVMQVFAPNASALPALEKRVATLEKAVGAARFEGKSEGLSLWDLVADVQNRLPLAADMERVERLKGDAAQVAAVLQRELQHRDVGALMKAAAVLEKMEMWEEAAESVPLVVARLRSLKRVHDDASGFATTLSSISAQSDSLVLASQDCSALVNSVQENMDKNLHAVQCNLDLLETRLRAALAEENDAAVE